MPDLPRNIGHFRSQGTNGSLSSTGAVAGEGAEEGMAEVEGTVPGPGTAAACSCRSLSLSALVVLGKKTNKQNQIINQLNNKSDK